MSTLPALRDRVTAPETLPTPRHPDVATWRPLTRDDLDVLLDLVKAADAVAHPDWTTPREELEEEFDAGHIDWERDSLLAIDADGRALAYGFVALGPGQETRVQSYLFGTVHPDARGRGIGRELLAWQRARSLQQLASSPKELPGWSLMYADETVPDAIRLAERLGLRIERWFTSMEREMSEPVPDVAAPEGIELVPFTESLSESTRLARNDAFRDHWGSQPTVPERWRQLVESAQFRPDLSRLAVETADDGTRRVVGFSLTTVNEEDWELRGRSSGYVMLIGVVRDRRGRRIAPAVVSAMLRAYRDAGLELAILDVDTASPTGADALYTGLGFRATTRSVALVAEV